MVEPKIKKWSYFTAFIIPCLILYIVFFITPFVRGVGISFTNWDGLTPKTPNSLEKDVFENEILNKLKSPKDKAYVLSIYEYDDYSKSYKRTSEKIQGMKKYKLQFVIGKTGFEPDANKFVGLGNYKKIFSGNLDKKFYPHAEDIQKFNKTSELPLNITKREFEREVLKNAKKKPFASDLLKSAYVLNVNNEKYVLHSSFDEFIVRQKIQEYEDLQLSVPVTYSDTDELISDFRNKGLEGNKYGMYQSVYDFGRIHKLSEEQTENLISIADEYLKICNVKSVLSEAWVVRQHYKGVIGFTLFFAVFSVIGINVVAFILALALDTGIRGQKIFRTVFFLPNVLSMIIVALIWSMLFVQLLPAVTGIEKWISDTNKTPWLLVLVAVWQGAGYYMIVYLAGLQNISSDVIEAAKIDGATGWQRFRYVTLPLMIPALTISLFLTIANALKSFDLMYAMIGSTGYATDTVPFVYDIYFDAFSNKQAGLATAKAMVLFFVIVLVTGIQLFIMKRKEVEA